MAYCRLSRSGGRDDRLRHSQDVLGGDGVDGDGWPQFQGQRLGQEAGGGFGQAVDRMVADVGRADASQEFWFGVRA